MTPSLKKRFWTEVSVHSQPNGFAVHLDNHPVRTPAKAPFVVPTKALANAIALEWQAQDKNVNPQTMPFTRRANAAIDKVVHRHSEVAQNLAEYGGSDLLCYRADHPDELCRRQADLWDPILNWAETRFSAPLTTTIGVMPHAQPSESLANLARAVAEFEPFPLAGFYDLVTISGSLVIGLAVVNRFMPVAALWQAARVDEIWQEEQWGKDEIASRATALKYQDFLDAESFFHASQMQA